MGLRSYVEVNRYTDFRCFADRFACPNPVDLIYSRARGGECRSGCSASALLVFVALASPAPSDYITLDFNDYDAVMPFRHCTPSCSDLYRTFYDTYERAGVTLDASFLSTSDTMKANIDELAYGGTSYELNGSGVLGGG